MLGIWGVLQEGHGWVVLVLHVGHEIVVVVVLVQEGHEVLVAIMVGGQRRRLWVVVEVCPWMIVRPA